MKFNEVLLVIGQIKCRNIRIFVTGKPYAELPAMHADVPVEPIRCSPKGASCP